MREITTPNGQAVLVPDVGEECESDQLIEICQVFDRLLVAAWIQQDLPPRPFIFDGCSGPAPDRLPWEIDLRVPCLLHDIAYWAAYPGAVDADRIRAAVDYRWFANDLILCGAPVELIDLIMMGVRSSGAWWPNAQWGYGRG